MSELFPPRVVQRTLSALSPWFKVVERHIDFGDGKIEIYHGVEQYDYVVILAITPDGHIPIVRQYRPALERYTWEFPAGLLDTDENPEQVCVRELAEETGMIARTVQYLGDYAPDTSRLGNRVHCFFVEADVDTGNDGEPQIELALVTFDRLCEMIRSGEFELHTHIAVILLVMLRPELVGFLSPRQIGRSGPSNRSAG